MAYGLRYFHEFKNNVLDVYRIEIHEKDYTGITTEIITTGSPIKIKYQSGEDRPIVPIRASEAEINFYSEEFLALLNFYSEDDERYRVDFIIVSIFDRDGLAPVYSGTSDVTVTTTAIIIDNQTSQNSIEPGMVIDILGSLYEITDAEYNPALNQLAIFVDTPPPAGFYPSEEFTIYEYISTDVNQVLWRGFMLQDNSSEEFQDPPYTIRIVATDNLALLKHISFDAAAEGKYLSTISLPMEIVSGVGATTIQYDPDLGPGDFIDIDGVLYELSNAIYNPETNVLTVYFVSGPANGDYTFTTKTYDIVDKLTLWDYFRVCIQATGVVLPVRIFNSLYETTQDATHDMFKQTRLFTGMFLDSDGVWQNCYEILEQILFALNATLIQADGYWNIVRIQELRAGGNTLSGFSFDENWENETAITLNRDFEIKLRTDICFIGADATKSINRPDKFSKETFNYEQPKSLIKGSDLQTLGAFIGSSTAVEDGVNYRYDRYNIPSFWTHEDSAPNASLPDASYIVVKTDTDNNVEVERYIYQPFVNYSFKSLEFNPIEVTAGDSFNFSLQFKNGTTDGSDNVTFRVRFLIITAAGHEYQLQLFNPGGGNPPYLRWNTGPTNPVVTDGFWKTNIGYGPTVVQSTTQFSLFDLSDFTLDTSRPKLPPIPVDGMLRIGIQGFTNTNTTVPDVDSIFKEVRIEFNYTFSDSLNVTGHTHTQTQSQTIKNNFDEAINIDDAPRNTIAGTLFPDVLTNFITGIGYVYFTKTALWGSGVKLGEIITAERKQLTKKPRTVIDGRIYGLRKSAEFITPLSVANIFTLQNLNFIFGVCEFDYYSNVFQATLNELYENGEAGADADYEFKYLYETT